MHHQETLVLGGVAELSSLTELAILHDLVKLFLTDALKLLLFMHVVPVERPGLSGHRVLTILNLLLRPLLVSKLVRKTRD